MTEYIVLAGAIGIGVAAALVSVGVALVSDYQQTRDLIILPVP